MLSSNSDAGVPSASQTDQCVQRFGSAADMYIYKLFVIQQPLRARMCGFGEKDRRPCTPPPILQLIIYNRTTLQPIDVEHIDTSFFTAACNLYSADMEVDMDLIRQRLPQEYQSGFTFGLSSSSSTQRPMQPPSMFTNNNASFMTQQQSVLAMAAGTERDSAPNRSVTHQTVQGLSLGQNSANSASIMSFSADGGRGSDSAANGSSDGGSEYNNDSTVCAVRNLIGASVATGAKLHGMDGSLGIFFVFPDLSIRKDGEYRFRFSFFDLQSETGDLMRTSAPIKARAFSEPFRVYSAKQFPGMIDSTALSKHFAKQGVKIPVRKESGKTNASYEDDDWTNG